MSGPGRFILFCTAVSASLLFKSFAYSFPQSDPLDWLTMNNEILMYSALGLYLLALSVFIISQKIPKYQGFSYLMLVVAYAFSLLEIGFVGSAFELIQFAALLSIMIAEIRYRQCSEFFSASLLLLLGMRMISYLRYFDLEAGTRVLFLIVFFILLVYFLQRGAIIAKGRLSKLYRHGAGVAFLGTFFSLLFSYGYSGVLLMSFNPENLMNTLGLTGLSLGLAVLISILVTWFAIGNTNEFAGSGQNQDS